MNVGVGNRETLVADSAITVYEQVQIHGSGLPADGAAGAALPGLDGLQSIQQRMGPEPRLDGGDGVHVRVVAESPPRESARAVAPTLEDAYLWCTSGVSGVSGAAEGSAPRT